MRLLLSLWVAEAWAAAGAGGEAHGASFFQIVYPMVNFLIFAYLIKRFLFPVARSYLRARRERIADAVKEAAEERARAEALVQEYRKRLGRLAAEAQQLSEGLRREGERLRARLVAEGEQLGAKIKADANFLAEQEMKAGRQQLRAAMAGLAQHKAAALLKRHLSPEDQRRLVREFTEGIGQVR